MKKLWLVTAIWCPTCLIMRPRYQDLASSRGWSYEEIDFDDNPDIILTLKIGKTLPVAIIYDDNTEIKRLIGEISRKKLPELLNQL